MIQKTTKTAYISTINDFWQNWKHMVSKPFLRTVETTKHVFFYIARHLFRNISDETAQDATSEQKCNTKDLCIYGCNMWGKHLGKYRKWGLFCKQLHLWTHGFTAVTRAVRNIEAEHTHESNKAQTALGKQLEKYRELGLFLPNSYTWFYCSNAYLSQHPGRTHAWQGMTRTNLKKCSAKDLQSTRK